MRFPLARFTRLTFSANSFDPWIGCKKKREKGITLVRIKFNNSSLSIYIQSLATLTGKSIPSPLTADLLGFLRANKAEEDNVPVEVDERIQRKLARYYRFDFR